MNETENKTMNGIETKDEKELSEVSGGFIGRDWDEDYDYYYDQLGILHMKNYLGKDVYRYQGHEIPREQAYKMVEDWKLENK